MLLCFKEKRTLYIQRTAPPSSALLTVKSILNGDINVSLSAFNRRNKSLRTTNTIRNLLLRNSFLEPDQDCLNQFPPKSAPSSFARLGKK